MLADLLYASGKTRPRHPKLAFANDDLTLLRQFAAEITAHIRNVPRQMNYQLAEELLQKWRDFDADTNAVENLINQIMQAAPLPDQPDVVGVKNTCLLPELYWLSHTANYKVKVLVCVRDPRDCVISYLTRHQKMYGEDDIGVLLALLNCSFMLDYMLLQKSNSVSEIRLIKYEDLATNPRQSMSQVLEFLGLYEGEYDWQSLDERSVINNSSFLKSSEADAVIPDAGFVPSIGNFNRLDADLIYFIERINRPVFEAYGYHTTESSSVLRQLKLILLISRLRECAERYDFAIHGVRRSVGEKVWLLATAIMWGKRVLRRVGKRN